MSTIHPMQSIELPAPTYSSTPGSLVHCLRARRSVRHFNAAPITAAELGYLLWAAQGITGPDGRRTAPSAGAIHPLRLSAVAGRVEGLSAGIYNYRCESHSLEPLHYGDHRQALAKACNHQHWLADAAVILCFGATAPHDMRGWRYVYLETGHSAQNSMLQAVALGLGSTLVGSFQHDDVKSVLQLNFDATPLCLLPVGHPHDM